MRRKLEKQFLNSGYQNSTFLTSLIGIAQEGVIIVSHSLRPIYLNLKAREICRQIWHDHHNLQNLPPFIEEIHQCLVKNYNYEDRVFMVDYPVSLEQMIRIRVSYLDLETEDELNLTTSDRPWLLISLEDRTAVLSQELQREQQKYNLTNRETEIWRFLSQSYTYQAIAEKMQVSLNTVKFHAKNIYAKKRIYQDIPILSEL
jgi:DNA-binding CsgD family transcriptional regulator